MTRPAPTGPAVVPVAPRGTSPDPSRDDLPARCRRLRGDRGAGMTAALVLLFAFTSMAVIWLARDVDRAVSNRGAAQSIAFQAARSGAQQVDLAGLRVDGVVRVEPDAARARAVDVADRLFAAYALAGEVVSVTVESDRVAVVVEVTDAGRTVTGVGEARAVEGAP